MNYYNKIFFFFLIVVVSCIACDPYEEDSIDIGMLPEEPTFTATVVADNANKIAIVNTSTGFYNFVWDIEGGLGLEGLPNRSTLDSDTITYTSMGTYTITLHAAKVGGNGTSISSQTFIIEENIVVECDEKFEDLTNDCTVQCWTLSDVAGAVKVGPTQLSGEWFTSGQLPPEQADDQWCFDFSDLSWTYNNNGATLSACQGNAIDDAYPIPTGENFNVLPSGASTFSNFKIVLNDGIWMGVEDSGSEYEIVSISDLEMVLLTPLTPCDGSPSPGWFTLTFKPAS